VVTLLCHEGVEGTATGTYVDAVDNETIWDWKRFKKVLLGRLPCLTCLPDSYSTMDALDALQEASRDKRLIPWEELLEDVKRSRQTGGL